MGEYILFENHKKTVIHALKESAKLIKGYKIKYFLLYLSFIGWVIPIFLLFLIFMNLVDMRTLISLQLRFKVIVDTIFMIPFLWLLSYVMVSEAQFYRRLKEIKNLIIEEKNEEIDNKDFLEKE